MKTGNRGAGKRNDGSAIVMVTLVSGIVAVMAASLVTFAQYEIGAMERAREDNMASAIAEAGANQAYALLKSNFANKSNAGLFPKTTYNGGSYDVTVTSVGSDKAQISCLGISGVSTSIVVCDIKNFSSGYGTESGDVSSPWGVTIFINGTAQLNGGGNIIGAVRANGTISTTGNISWGSNNAPCAVYDSVSFANTSGGSTLNGMVYAPVVNAGSAGIPRTIQAVSMISLPTIDLTPYYTTALANSMVFAGGSFSSGSFGTIPGGIRWYNGDVSFTGGVSYNGCLIATGAIVFKGGCTQTRVANYPAVVSRDSSVSLGGSRSMQGLIYAKGNLDCNGGGRLDGSICVGGNMTTSGNYGLFNYVFSKPIAPGAGSTSNDVAVTAWQK